VAETDVERLTNACFAGGPRGPLQLGFGGHLLAAVAGSPDIALNAEAIESEIEDQQAAVLHRNFKCELLPVKLAFLNGPLLFGVRAGSTGDLSAVLFETHVGGVGLGFSIGIGDIEAAGPLAGKLRGAQCQGRKQQRAQEFLHSVPPQNLHASLHRRKWSSICSRKNAAPPMTR
jgi:hypothetical protein